jgi:hypothetical protein
MHKYEVIRPIGEDSLGKVYLARARGDLEKKLWILKDIPIPSKQEARPGFIRWVVFCSVIASIVQLWSPSHACSLTGNCVSFNLILIHAVPQFDGVLRRGESS